MRRDVQVPSKKTKKQKGVIIRYLSLARCPRWQHIRKQMFLSQGATGGNGRWGSLCACLAKYVILLKEAVGGNVVRSDGKMYGMEGFGSGTGRDLAQLGKSRKSEKRGSRRPGGMAWPLASFLLPSPSKSHPEIYGDTEGRNSRSF